MSKVRFFQLMVGASFLTYVIYFFLPFIPIDHDSDVQNLLGYSGYGNSIPPGHPFIYIPSFLLKTISAVGLFLFLSWGRWLLLAHMAISLVLAPFLGITILLPIDVTIGFLSALLDGALLMLCFTQPYSDYMRKDDGANISLDPAATRRST